MKSILLHIHDDHAQDNRIAVALDLARSHHAHVTCLQVRMSNSLVVADGLGTIYLAPELVQAIDDRDISERARIEPRFQEAGIAWNWEHFDGEAAQALVSRGRLADLIIVSRQDRMDDHGEGPRGLGADVVVHARAPVLVVPPGATGFRHHGPVVVAWNGSIEIAHGLRLALTMLRSASAVHFVTVTEDHTDHPASDGQVYLERHGIASTLHVRSREGRSIGDTLLAAARKLDASCLVMGAYGHSRMREMVLGGVTRELLAQTTVPLMLAH